MSELEEPEEVLEPFKLEAARSGRSKCKTCRKAIPKDGLRLGILITGPFGQGYIWHHLNCAAKRQWESLEQAYEGTYYDEQLELPALDDLRSLREKSEKERAEKLQPPYAEVAPTGRSKCKHCEELIEKGAFRVVLARNVEFYGQQRKSPVNVHAGCVAEELQHEDAAIEVDGFEAALRENSRKLEPDQVTAALAEIGSLH